MFIRWLRLLSVKVWFQYGSQGITSNHWHPEMHQEVIRIISQLLYQQVKLSLLMSCLLDQTDVVDLDCLFFSHDVRTTKLSSLLDDSIMSRIVNFTTNTVTGASAGDSTWKISVWNVFCRLTDSKNAFEKNELVCKSLDMKCWTVQHHVTREQVYTE